MQTMTRARDGLSWLCRIGRHRGDCDEPGSCHCKCHRPARAERARDHAEELRRHPRPQSNAITVFDRDGRRICPACQVILVRANPTGPGRYPKFCPDCR